MPMEGVQIGVHRLTTTALLWMGHGALQTTRQCNSCRQEGGTWVILVTRPITTGQSARNRVSTWSVVQHVAFLARQVAVQLRRMPETRS